MSEQTKQQKIRNAIFIGVLCSTSYLAVYFARNILSAVSPQMIESGGFSTEYIGTLSSIYFSCYAVGQLINGAIGDKIKARYMISFGLIFAGLFNILFPMLSGAPFAAQIAYGFAGFALSMVYGPMTKVVSENTDPIYTPRCCLGYTFASFFGTPLAGVVAAVLTWQQVFATSSIALLVMGVVCFVIILLFERMGVIRYGQYKKEKQQGLGIRVLIRHRIIRFTLISVLTGIVRTTVVFWLPTYLSQYLGFPAAQSAGIFTVSTFIISLTPFIAIFVYERLNRNMDLTIRIAFTVSTITFLLTYLIPNPILNLCCLILAIMASNAAASMLFSRYCPSLRDTGMVSAATGFLDFMSYMAAAVSSTLFANAVSDIGWKNLILVWLGLMICGMLTAFIRFPERRAQK